MKTRHFDRIGNGGITFTEMGFGTAPLGNLFRALSEEEAQATLQAAWNAGARYFDTAPLYGLGLSETRMNRFLRNKPREDYILSTKVGRILVPTTPENRDGRDKWIDVPDRTELFDYTYDGVMRSLEFSFERLGVSRVDILYAHDLDMFSRGDRGVLDDALNEFISGGYKALLELRDQGVIKGFGAGVNEWESCQWLAERGDFDLFLLAGRYTLLEQTALDSFLPLAQERGIGLVVGGAYNSGILATGPTDGAMYNYAPAAPDIRDRVTRIKAICGDHGTRLIDAAFQFPLLHPAVVSVIPGGQGVRELNGSVTAAAAEIPDALWRDLKSAGLLRTDAPTP